MPWQSTTLRWAVRCKACARRAAWGVWADPRRGHQRAQGGMGWTDAVGGKGRLIFLSPWGSPDAASRCPFHPNASKSNPAQR
jgi:hypothetical protein